MEPTGLQTTWYVLLGAVWVLYLVLGGTDLGIGQLVRRTDRQAALRAIGPTWAANDVWLIIAVAITFGAFPAWYASLLSGAYLPFVALVGAVMLRHAGMELVGHATLTAQPRWERVIVTTSVAIPFMWGLIWAGAIDGTLAASRADAGLGLITPTGALVGLTLAALCRVQGIAFLRVRAPQLRRGLVILPSAVAAGGLLIAATEALAGAAADDLSAGAVGRGFAALAVAGLAVLLRAAIRSADRPALVGAAATMAGAVGCVLAALYRTPIAGGGPQAVNLSQAAAGSTTLSAMLAIAIVLLPGLLLVLAYAYTRFSQPRVGGPRRSLGAVVADAARVTLRELR